MADGSVRVRVFDWQFVIQSNAGLDRGNATQTYISNINTHTHTIGRNWTANGQDKMLKREWINENKRKKERNKYSESGVRCRFIHEIDDWNDVIIIISFVDCRL